MTRREMSEIFAALLLAYPNAEAFKGGIQKLGPTINLWTSCLPEVDFWTGQQAVVKLVRECKFPPTIAEFREKAERVRTEVTAEINQAWNALRLEMSLDGKTPQDACADFPVESRIRQAIDAMGGPGKLLVNEERTYGDGRKEIHECFNYDGFAAAYERLLRQTSALGAPGTKAVGQGMKQIGGKTR